MIEDMGIRPRDRLLRAQEVQEMTGIGSRVTLWRKSNDRSDHFPTPYRYGLHYTRWKLSEIEDWIDSLKCE